MMRRVGISRDPKSARESIMRDAKMLTIQVERLFERKD